MNFRKLHTIIVGFILICSYYSSSYSFELVKKGSADYHMMCGCDNTCYVKHFEDPEATTDDFTNATREFSEKYGAIGSSNKITTADGGDYSELTIPDDIVHCYMEGHLCRLSGVYKTTKGKSFEISGEYTISGYGPDQTRKIQSISLIGLPYWKEFEVYFNLRGLPLLPAIVKNLKIKIKSPDATTPVYVDEVRICTFCDGTIPIEGPKLSALTATPGKWNTSFKTGDNNYTIRVDKNTDKIDVTATTFTAGVTIAIKGMPATSGVMKQIDIGNAKEISPVDIFLKKSDCEQSNYILNFIREAPLVNDPTLIDLIVSPGLLTPSFEHDNDPLSYVDYVDPGTSLVKVTPVAYDPEATYTINGGTTPIKSGVESDVDVSTNKTLTILVTAKDGLTQKTYQVVVVEDNRPEVNFEKSYSSVAENTPTHAVSITLSKAPVQPLVISVYQAAGKAIEGDKFDYTIPNPTVTFNPGDPLPLKNDITVNIIDDDVVDGNKNLTLGFKDDVRVKPGSIKNHTIDIVDNEFTYIRYVNCEIGVSGLGRTWKTAYKYLQDALAEAREHPGTVTEIRVAKGTYYPDETNLNQNGTNLRSSTFQMVDGVKLIGGYFGLFDTPDTPPDHVANVTTLSGNIDHEKPNSTLDGNSYHVVTAANSIIDGFTITAGYADAYQDQDRDKGAGLLSIGVSPTIKNCSILLNYACSFGSGIYLEGGTPVIQNTHFENNSVSGVLTCGGGVYTLNSNVTIESSIFSHNHLNGYRGCNGGAIVGILGYINIMGCIFEDNIASNYGGAISGSGTFTIESCNFEENRSTEGGAINFSGSSNITKCKFIGNIAADGGAIYLGDGTHSVVNSVFFDNSADGNGGAIATYSFTGKVSVINSTFSINSAISGVGGAISSYNSNMDIANCIFWYNSAFSDISRDIFHTEHSMTVVAYSDIQQGYVGDHNKIIEPNFYSSPELPSGYSDLKLKCGSLCINQADNSRLPVKDQFDVDGVPRNGQPDMGAYENVGPCP